jgi:MYXO-CTERM domain-containing protein
MTSSRLWAIVTFGQTALSAQPSIALSLGGPGPIAPTEVKTVSAEKGLVVSWTPKGDASTLFGHQVLCSPAPATPGRPWYDTTCAVSKTDGGTGPFDPLDAKFLCSDLIAVGSNSTRVQGLENGRTYQIAVIAVGLDYTPSAPSAITEGTPAPTVGFGDLYGESGGTATGCAVGGSGIGSGAGLAAIAIALVFAWRRRRRLPLLALPFVIAFGARPAAAADFDTMMAPAKKSERAWNVELRFGPYRPNVDSEFADRGESARPYEEVFSSARHLMTQLEIDHHLSHRGGTWAAGVGVGYFKVTAAALTQNLQARSGDETGLRLIPLSAVGVYRADILRERWGSPIVPYAKVGLDCTLWRISDTSQADLNGRTFGWHAAGGVTLDLAPLDREAAHEMDRESGVNQAALFFEVTRYALDGFGSSSALHVGDFTWFAGLMLEL